MMNKQEAIAAMFASRASVLAEEAKQRNDIPLIESGFPVIALGFGKIEVGEGHQNNVPALIFGINGSGEIGAPTQPDREHEPGETLAVVTFANVEGLDVVLHKLQTIRRKMVEQFPEAA